MEVHEMARKRYSEEECLKALRQVEVELAAGADGDQTVIVHADLHLAGGRGLDGIADIHHHTPLDVVLTAVLTMPPGLAEDEDDLAGGRYCLLGGRRQWQCQSDHGYGDQ